MLKGSGQDETEKKKQEVHNHIEKLTPEQLAKVLEFARSLASGENNELSEQMKQSNSSTTAGSL